MSHSEINFEYNSSVLVDGYPSLLRIAELLQKNPGYKVKVEGHTDIIGGGGYNDKLGMARATAKDPPFGLRVVAQQMTVVPPGRTGVAVTFPYTFNAPGDYVLQVRLEPDAKSNC